MPETSAQMWIWTEVTIMFELHTKWEHYGG